MNPTSPLTKGRIPITIGKRGLIGIPLWNSPFERGKGLDILKMYDEKSKGINFDGADGGGDGDWGFGGGWGD